MAYRMTREEESNGYIHGPGGEEEEEDELSSGDTEDDVSSCNDSDTDSVETAFTENDHPAGIDLVPDDMQIRMTPTLWRDGMIPGDEVGSNGEDDWSSMLQYDRFVADALYNSYALVRLVGVEYEHMLQTLDENVGTISQIPSIVPLNDGSLEILVLKAYIPGFHTKMRELYPKSTLDPKHDPFRPTEEDAEYWGLDNARALYMIWFAGRAKDMKESSWFIAKVYYACEMERKRVSWIESIKGTAMSILVG